MGGSSSSRSSTEMGESSSRCGCSSSEVRIQHSLNKKEKVFMARRKKTVLQCLQKLQIYCDWDAVPNIALLGSGGGQRAMVGLLGSLAQLDKAGLLDCILYLSGVSGSTWCMASLYKEPDWSTKLDTVKDKIIKRLNGPGVSWEDTLAKLMKYWESTGKNGKNFSMTHVWAAAVLTTYVKEIDEHTLTDQWDQHSKDPFPIYTVIDKECKQQRDGDPSFEISPYEAGYSLTGAFVETSSFGSQFDNGRKIKELPEMDMLYLQALCGSALADEVENTKYIWKTMTDESFHDLIDYLYDKDPSAFGQAIGRTLKVLTESQGHLMGSNTNVLNFLSIFSDSVSDFLMWPSIHKCFKEWIWGRKYNFLHKMTDERVPDTLLESETRDYIDTGVLLNSPYFSVLREERNIDLIISLDFSEGDPFMTVTKAATMCKKQNIPFPEVNIFKEDPNKPKDFYVFKGQNTPTVIHMPLFNVVNCGDDIETWRNKYHTFQGAYSAEMIAELMEVAGKNISNNREKLKEQIWEVIINK